MQKGQECTELRLLYDKLQKSSHKYETLAQERLNVNEGLEAKLTVEQGQVSELKGSLSEVSKTVILALHPILKVIMMTHMHPRLRLILTFYRHWLSLCACTLFSLDLGV